MPLSILLYRSVLFIILRKNAAKEENINFTSGSFHK